MITNKGERSVPEIQSALAGYIVHPGEGRRVPVPYARAALTMKAESPQTGGRVTIYESRQEAYSVGPARHYHEHLTEVFYVLDGCLTFLIDKEIHMARAGAMVVIPPGAVHAFRNGQSQPARLLVVVLPGGFEGFFAEAQGMQVPMGDAPQWQRINERWDTHVVGPPLELEIGERPGANSHAGD